MRKILAVLGCALLVLSACGKDDDTENKEQNTQVQVQKAEEKKPEVAKKPSEETIQFFNDFEKYDPAQKYYFCAAFAMGAMSVVKPVTASAMVNYFMGLGVAKYGVGIEDHTYKSFNAGKNVFKKENLVNAILERKVCENIMNEAADFARERNYNIADLDKRGQKEVEKVVKYIKQKKK